MAMNYLDATLMYMGCNDKNSIDNDQLKKVKEAMLIVEKHSDFLMLYKKYSLNDKAIVDFRLNNKSLDLDFYLDGCKDIVVIASTLGIEFERYLKKISIIDMSKAVLLDCAASAYLEIKTNEQEEKVLNTKEKTFRFAPGYGDIPIAWNKFFANDMMLQKKVGITLSESGLFVPQKSMLGIIGIGTSKSKRQCKNCIRKQSCKLRKQGIRCWDK